jgi:hypothetical protein
MRVERIVLLAIGGAGAAGALSFALAACSSSSSGGGSPGPLDDGGDAANADLDAGGDGGSCVPSESLDAGAVAAGFTAVQTRKCGFCHQDADAGTGVLLSGRDSPVRGAYGSNLTPDPATGLGCWTDSQIATAIVSGTDRNGNALCVMPTYGAVDGGIQTGSTELDDIVQYLRSIPPVSHAVQATDCAALAGSDGGASDAGDASAQPTTDAATDAGGEADGAGGDGGVVDGASEAAVDAGEPASDATPDGP